MNSNENNGPEEWLMDYGLVEELAAASDYIWSSQFINHPTVSSSQILGLDAEDLQNQEDFHPNKRARGESSTAPATKACREKMRRDKLNDRFKELYSILDPGKPLKADKVAILRDAACHLSQLRLEAKQLKESNGALHNAIKKLKAEKSELRDEKTRLRSEKEKMEQMLQGFNNTPPFFAQPAAAMHAASAAAYSKAIVPRNFAPISMWQWVPTAALDTSQDHVLRPPVA
ncbi:transcription factor ILR3-like [Canna indica]|uniref:Transcription factor ILR3-like n=1 Tax=Canna indica TaxID=4628 RepID=A0AAQ3K9G6_9LILI|nr:transcription factor ILR3-like [Canna indica]